MMISNNFENEIHRAKLKLKNVETKNAQQE